MSTYTLKEERLLYEIKNYIRSRGLVDLREVEKYMLKRFNVEEKETHRILWEHQNEFRWIKKKDNVWYRLFLAPVNTGMFFESSQPPRLA